MEGLTIGRLAKRCHVNVETVRFYERRGLLPYPPRGASGYRHYSEDIVARLQFIKGAQAVGFTLKELAELLSLRVNPVTSAAEIRKRSQAKIADIDAKILALKKMKRALAKVQATCAGRGPTSECPILEALGSLGRTRKCQEECD